MRASRGFAILALPLTLAACGPDTKKADVGLVGGAVAGGIIGSSFGRGSGNVLATAAGAVVGGIIGNEIGRQLDARDRLLAQEAEFDALERGESGRVRTWRNPDNGRYGEVVPSRPYRRADRDCRDFTHKVFIDGRPQALRGTACRNPDGTWSNVS